MKKIIFITAILLLSFASTIYIIKEPGQGNAFLKPTAESVYETAMKQDILTLMLAYPENIKDIEKGEGGQVFIVLKSGTKLIYDDQKKKSIEGKMAYPDLQDMLEQPYPLVTTKKLMDKDFDPGRIRVYALLKEAYGGSRQQIENKLANIKAGGRSFQFNYRNGAGNALKAALGELMALSAKNSRVAAAAFPTSGTYNYRVISGTNRLSPHAFGIAIDLARDKRDYWQWASREEGQKRLDVYPTEIVEVFERYNFIWGGKWGHFDTLHFEYRPEIILKAKYFGGTREQGSPWYKGVPEDTKTRELIELIEQAL